MALPPAAAVGSGRGEDEDEEEDVGGVEVGELVEILRNLETEVVMREIEIL